MVGKLKDRAGQRIGRLTIVSFARREHYDGGTKIFWLCRCDCGAEKVINAVKFSANKAMSCGGCPKPGGSRTKWSGYSSLKAAKSRCLNPKHKAYPEYGGRGITICDRWLNGADGRTGFECFFDDMGPRPVGKTLDRIEVKGNYEPSNCRWATKREQQQNQRRAIYYNVGGVQVPLKKYARRLGICYESVRFRVRKHNETVSEAVRGLLSRRAA